MAFIIFLAGIIGFGVWLFRQPSEQFLVNLGPFPGAMILFGLLLRGIFNLQNHHSLNLAFFISAGIVIFLAKLRKA